MKRLMPFALVALLALGSSSANASTPTREPNEPIPVPETDDEIRELRITVCQCAAELGPDVTPAQLRMCVAARLWAATEWPPIPSDPQSVRDVWGLLTATVQAWKSDPEGFAAAYCAPLVGGFDPGPGPGGSSSPPSGGFDPGPSQPPSAGFNPMAGPVYFARLDVSSIPPDLAYPWEAAYIHESSQTGEQWPTPGMFFEVGADNLPQGSALALNAIVGIARVALASAYAMGGAPRTLAQIPDSAVAAYVDLIACSPFNDALFGTDSVQAMGGTLGMGPHGRGINMFPRHGAVLEDLASGVTPQRKTLIGGAPDSQTPAPRNRFAFLWLPPIRLDLLVNNGAVTTAGLEWSDGSTVLLPPPFVWALGVSTRVAPPGASFWGCA